MKWIPWRTEDGSETKLIQVTVLAVAAGWAMVRIGKARPFVVEVKALKDIAK